MGAVVTRRIPPPNPLLNPAAPPLGALGDGSWLQHQDTLQGRLQNNLEGQLQANSLAAQYQGRFQQAVQDYQSARVSHPPRQEYKPPDRVLLSVNPQSTIAANKIAGALSQLPMRLAGKITSITFVEKLDHNHKPTAQVFAVTYTNNHVLEFGDVDAFPSEADIARIALECP